MIMKVMVVVMVVGSFSICNGSFLFLNRNIVIFLRKIGLILNSYQCQLFLLFNAYDFGS